MSSGFLGNLVGLLGRRGARPHKLAPLAEALLSSRGEASGVALARQILDAYAESSYDERLAFFQLLATDFGTDQIRVAKAIASYQAEPGAAQAMALHAAAEPRRQEMIRRLNLAAGGTVDLVRMRQDLLRALPMHAELEPVDADFVHLFVSWFNRGFLEIRRIDWSTPAHILEKIIRYEAVHEITSWDDLRRRIEPADRRCFAFFHPALPDEPLVFVEVALTIAIPEAIASLLAEGRRTLEATRARTAVFYSISNCQAGLRGVSFGSFLIKQVVEELHRGLPALDTFVTLSPVPGFGPWLRGERKAANSVFFSGGDFRALELLDRAGWTDHADTPARLQPLLTEAVAHYLLEVKSAAGKPLDSVARFHLNNGAKLEAVRWLGDRSDKGLTDAAGFMVNYLYDPDQIERNHEAYANQGEIAASRQVKKLLERRKA
jgi:malonyl-CoA decarboxylase